MKKLINNSEGVEKNKVCVTKSLGHFVLTIATILIGITCQNVYASNGWHFLAHRDQSKKLSKLSKLSSKLNKNYFKRFPLPFVDDIYQDQASRVVKLTDRQQHQAIVWGLTVDQEKRYVLLMQNRTGHYYKKTQLTPVEILGINARSDQEREKYSQLAAYQEFQKNAKFLAYNAAYNHAAIHLKDVLHLPIIRRFNYSAYSPYNYQPIMLKASDKLMLFIMKEDSVKPIVSYLMTQVEKAFINERRIQLNIFFLGPIKNKDITKWAHSQNIPPKMVNQQLITLNLDQGQYSKLTLQHKKTPVLILVRNGRSYSVNIGRF